MVCPQALNSRELTLSQSLSDCLNVTAHYLKEHRYDVLQFNVNMNHGFGGLFGFAVLDQFINSPENNSP